MKYLKTIPYAGVKSDDDVSVALDVYRRSSANVFVDRFAGSGKVGIAALQHTDALVEFWEIDPQLLVLYDAMFFGTQYERWFVERLIAEFNTGLAKADDLATAWDELRLECRNGSTHLGRLAAFIAVQQNVASSNPRRNAKGDRNGGLDKTKVGPRGFTVPDLTEYADRVAINETHDGTRFSYCDVPYYSPRGTQCYFGHNPRSTDNLEQYILTTIDAARNSVQTMYCNCNFPEVSDRLAQLGASGPFKLEKLSKGSQRAGKGESVGHAYWLL